MLSFSDMCDLLEEQNEEEQSKSVAIINKGLQFAKPGCKDFWESFQELCNDADGFADLLGVSKEQVIRWPALIDAVLSQVRTSSDQSVSDRDKIIPTENEPLADPDGQDLRGTTADLRPA
jgi:hypothetical protein